MRTFALALALAAVALPAAADHHEAAEKAANPTQQAYLFVWDDGAKKTLDLARAIPADKYSWRPAEGVRSVAEAFQHISGGIYYLTMMLGVEPPAGHPSSMAEAGALEKSTAKDEVIASLEKALAYARQLAIDASPELLAKEVDFFGSKIDGRTMILLLNVHLHEHLGQEIAYARSIGVVPPWSQPQPPASTGY